MELNKIKLDLEEDVNLILGQSHFIKTVEDLFEIIQTSMPQPKFGLAFAEASGDKLIRYDGTDGELTNSAIDNLKRIKAGHVFIILLRDLYPINILNAIKNCQEVCRIYCATANPVEVITAETEQGASILGVVDGSSPTGVESDEDKKDRKELLRKIKYKKS